jgi:phage terminase large subunit
MQLLTLIGQKEQGGISVVSPSLPHLKRGVIRDFMQIVGDGEGGQGIYDVSKHNKTDQVYNFTSNSYIEFFGAENEGKVRGPGRRVLFINEANLISFELFTQLALRTTGTIFIDFNPADLYSWVYQIAERPNAEFIHSTYKNNAGNLSKEQIQEIEYLREADQNLWKVYGLGLRGTSSETIYTHWLICDTFPEGCTNISYGLDFGYVHPACLMKTGEKDGRVYAQQLIYQSGLTNADLAHYIRSQLGFTRMTGAIWADPSRPEAIQELRLAGLDVREAKKDVKDGIMCVKSMPLYFTRDSTEAIKEAKSYKFKKNADGTVSEEPVKFKDDAMDALRYARFSINNKQVRQTAVA